MQKRSNSLHGRGFPDESEIPPKADGSRPPAIRVVAAAILSGAGVLIARRAEGKKQAGRWELPGGKIEPGETPESALVREIREELSIEIHTLGLFAENTHNYGDMRLQLLCYTCVPVEDIEHIRITSTDHSDVRVVAYDSLSDYRFAEADIPIVNRLMAAQPRA